MFSHLDIPLTLWQQGQLRLPQPLAEALKAELMERGLFEQACGPHVPEKELYGGKDQTETVLHFAHRFKTSAARVQFVVLNPNGTFEPLAATVRGCMLDGKVAVLDIPCGSGGGLLGLLATIAELRVQGSHPRLPLEIKVLAGDCSAEALAIHNSILGRIRPHFETVGMRLSWQHADWDVTKQFSTTALMDRWFQFCPDCEEYLVFVSAFSGFADRQEYTDHVLRSVRDIAVRLYNRNSLIAWIEPMSNQSTRFIPRLAAWLVKLFGWSPREKGDYPAEEFAYIHPYTGEVLPGRARVLPYETLQT